MESPSIQLVASSLLSISVIFGVLLVATFLLRRLRGTAWGRRAVGQSPIHIAAVRGLGGHNTLVIAEVEGHRFLLGVSRGGISAIGRIDGHE
ncbi:flagellar biosynthetic protein FliO [Acidocella sp.]|uniref:flagellar biosynthetic protein FliO n=1 Tax=Acidocella sp. TaxID=50710 RepID=UPI0026285173|nr:flagellar biosynthetic protein FliO [Acidocella sp.]MDD2796033.1 flagellar biosynthetic protein FliO [Acidocella sp.]